MSAHKKIIGYLVVGVMILAGPVWAQLSHISVRPLTSNVIIPQCRARAFAPDRRKAIEITEVNVLIDILESTAVTTIELQLHNTTRRRQEAELIVPVPDGAVCARFCL